MVLPVAVDKGVFVAAALEYAVRGHGIREAAFFGGYAPLVFQRSAWKIYVDALRLGAFLLPVEAKKSVDAYLKLGNKDPWLAEMLKGR